MSQDVKRMKGLPNYRINIHAISPRHPLGVKPSGNALLAIKDIKETKNMSAKLLGDFGKFTEELLVELLFYITDPTDLKNLGHSSRLLYAYSYNEEYWRNLYVREYRRLEKLDKNQDINPFASSNWRGSWRKTVLNINSEALLQSRDLIFSDILYRPYQCSQINYKRLFKQIIDLEEKSYEYGRTLNDEFGIKRFQEEDLSEENFRANYISQPFILQCNKVDKRWPRWDLDHLLKLFPEERFRQEAVQWDLSKYIAYARDNRDESPLYLFDCNGAAIKEIGKQYEPSAIFKDDYFKLFKQRKIQCRPDHRWLIAGPERSGSTFHKDPNQTSAWNTVLSGMKLWIMLPPEVQPPGISTDREEDEVTAPIGISEWILSGFYNDSVQLAQKGQCLIGITFPGECIHVPSGWWHSVINITDSVALTENFVPEPVLGKVLNFLKNKNSQLSGFHLKDVVMSIRAFFDDYKEPANSDPNEASHVRVLRTFIDCSEKYELNNEDCGLHLSSELQIPVYEFFIELIKRSPKQFVLPKALKELAEIERQNDVRELKESAVWEKLKKTDEVTFAFAFEVE